MPDRRKILVAESNQEAARFLTAALRERGLDVVLASDSVFALSLARRERPDAIVLTTRLPGGGGIVALKRIRSSVHTAAIPVIAIDARGGPHQQEWLWAGAQVCLEQPVDTGALYAAIQKHLERPPAVGGAPAEVLSDPQRMAALNDAGLLDSAPDELFDSVTRLAVKLIGAPIVLVSLVDRDRQFFKSQVGLSDPWAASRQTPLSHSFCQWVVSGQEELVVDDAREHPTLRTNLAVRDLGVMAYAGVPLHGKASQTIGSFCAVDGRPHPWSDDELAALRNLVGVVEAYIVLGQEQHDLRIIMSALGNGLLGAARVLLRGGPRLGDTERSQLLAMIEQLSQHLTRFAREPQSAA